MGIDTTQIARLALDLNVLSAAAGARASQAVRKTGLDCVTQAQARCPVDTGNLRASIGMTEHNQFAVEVGPTANYGMFIELGTSRMGPRPFLGPAVDAVTPGFTSALAALVGR